MYSNLAACFTKLGALNDALKAADRCIELAPTFVKGYSRKGSAQFFMKDYEKAMETYEAGLELEPDNEEIQAGLRGCMDALNRCALQMSPAAAAVLLLPLLLPFDAAVALAAAAAAAFCCCRCCCCCCCCCCRLGVVRQV